MSAVLALVCGALVIVADQLTKYAVINNMELYEVIRVIPGILNFNRISPNSGAAFGIFEGKTWFLVTVTLIIMILCICLLIRKTFGSKLLFWAVSLVLGGGIGNMIDRVFRGGNVVDFLELPFLRVGTHVFPVFNVADCAVCIGAALMVVYFVIELIRDSKMQNGGKIEIINNGGEVEDSSGAEEGKNE